ncbi:MAG TPA: DUF3820 family protein [Polyangiaceae bacterium]|nr:DUF3820 family protein [Polyangiaceae bacterium]
MPEQPSLPDAERLLELCRYRMPFGKYQGMRLVQLPEAYLAWFARQGMPSGTLGEYLETALVIRSSGLEKLIAPILAELDRNDR